nr:amino acid permease [Streptomyces inhibens]
MLAAVVPHIGFFTGAEIVTIAAAESVEPERAVADAIRSIVLRVVAFHVLSLFLVVAVVPWTSKAIEVSPYAAVLDRLAVPAAGTVMNAIALIAVLSCLNSALYTSSRMLFALTRNGDAPRGFTKVSGGGVPRRALLAGTSVVHLAIAVARVRLRRKPERTELARLTLKMWLFPWLSRVTIALMALVIGAMAFLPDSRSRFWPSLLTVAVVPAGYEPRRRVGGRRQGVSGG